MSKILSKYFFLLAASVFLLTSCSSTKSTMNSQDSRLAEMNREDYTVLNQVEGEAKSTKLWFLFIPFGGKNQKKMESKAYNRAVSKLQKADGLIDARYEYKKIVIPLIVVTPVIKKVKAIGRGYRLKTDREMKKKG